MTLPPEIGSCSADMPGERVAELVPMPEIIAPRGVTRQQIFCLKTIGAFKALGLMKSERKLARLRFREISRIAPF
jgi:hypothetical protein